MPPPLSEREEKHNSSHDVETETEDDEEDDEEEDDEEDEEDDNLSTSVTFSTSITTDDDDDIDDTPPYLLRPFSERSIKVNLIRCLLSYADRLEFIMQSESLEGIKFRCTKGGKYVVIELLAIKCSDEQDFSDLDIHSHLVDEDYLFDSVRNDEMTTVLKKIKMNSAIKLDYIEFVKEDTTLFTLRTNKT